MRGQALKSILVERRTRRTRARIETCPVTGEVHGTVFRVAGIQWNWTADWVKTNVDINSLSSNTYTTHAYGKTLQEFNRY